MRRFHVAAAVAALTLGTSAAQAQTYDVQIAPFEDPEGRSLAALANAQATVDVAQYNIRNDRFFDALTQLRDRGVHVRVVVDAKNARQPWNTLDDRLEAAGFAIRRVENTSSNYAIMHHKFCVIDDRTVLTGSYNWNHTAQLVNDENLLVIHDPAVAAGYAQEFAELWGDTPEAPGVTRAGTAEVLFSPEDRVRDRIVQAIRAAQHRIRVAMFTFTDHTVARALADAAHRGVDVTLVTERKQADRTRADERVANSPAHVLDVANTSSTHSAMHHKFCVIDDRLVITGACNWTYTAFHHSNEDVLLLDDPALAATYTRAFGTLIHRYTPQSFHAPDYGIHAPQATTQFVLTHPNTQPGDRVLITGAHPALGAWDPSLGLELTTSEGTFPSWTGRLTLPAGASTSWKAVVLHPDGSATWDLGHDHTLSTDPHGTHGIVVADFHTFVDVTLTAHTTLLPGQELRLVGADPLLGNWDPALGLPLSPDPLDPTSFSTHTTFPGRAQIPCKLVLIDPDGTPTWEDGPDRLLSIHDHPTPQTLDLP